MSYESYDPAPVDFDDLARELVEILRVESDLNYNKCQNFADLVVTILHERLRLPDLVPVMEALQKDVLDIPTSLDTKRLRKCFSDMNEFVEDSQQRSWTLFEDGESILDNQKAIDSLIVNADKRVSLFVLSEDDHRALNDLVRLYQMETRAAIRVALLASLRLICLLSPEVVSVALSTVLPVELAQDILADRSAQKKSVKFSLSVDLLAMLFCTGELIPLNCYDVLNEDFFALILEIIEENDEGNAQLTSVAMNLILAFNLHLSSDYDDNCLLRVIQKSKSRAKHFAERLLLLLNRKNDPVWLYSSDHESPYVSSMLKMLSDVLNDNAAVTIFYANDLLVLVDVVLREVRDLSPGKRRTEHLRVLSLLAKNPESLVNRLEEIKLALQHLDEPNETDTQLLADLNKLLI